MPVRYRLASSASAISASPDFTQVIVAGRDVLRILNLESGAEEITEGTNLRTGRVNLNFSSNDVKWCPIHYCKNIIATAATNGSIVIWDLYREGQKQERVVTEHQRAVNRICFHPSDPIILLSASQDGTTKLWDLRDQGQAKVTFEGKAESVRDVQFSPTESFTFATAFENGTLQTWDMRNPGKFIRRIAAHNGPIFTIDWHPSGKYVATGSRDKTIKVWDMRNEQRKASFTIQTFEAVGRIQWRPNEPNQLASSALLIDRRVHVWDLKRPYIPLYSFDSHEDTTTGILWQDQDKFYSCSKDQFFIKNFVSDAYQPAELYRPTSVSWNAAGELSFTNSINPVDTHPEDEFIVPASFPNFFRAPKVAVPKGKAPEKPTELKGINVVEFKPGQRTGIIQTNTFSEENFVALATKYQVSGDSPMNLCRVNMKIARDLGREEGVQFWKMIELFLLSDQESNSFPDAEKEVARKVIFSDDEPPKPTDEQLETASQNTDLETNGTQVSDLPSPDSSDEETQFLPQISLKKDLSQGKLANQDATSPSKHQEALSVALSTLVYPEWDHMPVIQEMLEYFAEIGDVQMCVTVLLVLRFKVTITSRQEQQWFISYIELLQRFRLWSQAATIISLCNDNEIRRLSQESTTIHTTCNLCKKPLMSQENGYYMCTKCRGTVSKCSLCHQTVRGIYVWCQGCSHGGHLEHIRAWFAENTECPTGCGHRCNYGH